MDNSGVHVDFNNSFFCKNLTETGGDTCVKCNACGRFNKETHIESEIALYKRHIQEEYEFDNWIEGYETVQRKVIAENIKYFRNKIALLENQKMADEI